MKHEKAYHRLNYWAQVLIHVILFIASLEWINEDYFHWSHWRTKGHEARESQVNTWISFNWEITDIGRQKTKKGFLQCPIEFIGIGKSHVKERFFFFRPIVNTIHKGTSTTNYTLNREILIVCRIYSRFRSPRVL